MGPHIYIYGGTDGSHWKSSLHQLNTSSLKWSQLATAGHGPMRKGGCGMVSHDNHLLILGGYGAPSGPTQPGAEFIKDSRSTGGLGWTNEVHSYDLKEGEGV